MGSSSVNSDTPAARPGLLRRDFLVRAAIGAAAAVGLSAVVRRSLSRSGASETSPMGLDRDSIFWPRDDALKRMLGRK